MLRFDAERHEYFWDEVKKPCVSNIIACLHDFGGIPQSVLETKREFGISVHSYLEMSDNGTLDPDKTKWDERMIPYVDAWQRFREQYQLTTDPAIEERFYNEKLQYAGTRDRRWPGVIIDIKTSAPNDIAGVQLAGYAASLPDAGNTRLMACFLTDDGSYKVREYNYKKYFNIFMCCHTIYNFKHGGR